MTTLRGNNHPRAFRFPIDGTNCVDHLREPKMRRIRITNDMFIALVKEKKTRTNTWDRILFHSKWFLKKSYHDSQLHQRSRVFLFVFELGGKPHAYEAPTSQVKNHRPWREPSRVINDSTNSAQWKVHLNHLGWTGFHFKNRCSPDLSTSTSHVFEKKVKENQESVYRESMGINEIRKCQCFIFHLPKFEVNQHGRQMKSYFYFW